MRVLHRFIRWLGRHRWFAAAGRRFGAPLDRGHRRTTPVMYLREGDRFVVASENFGRQRHTFVLEPA